MYPIRTINWDLFGFTEIERRMARRVEAHARKGNTIPKTMRTTTAPLASKPFLCKRIAKAQTYRIRPPIRMRLRAKRWELDVG